MRKLFYRSCQKVDSDVVCECVCSNISKTKWPNFHFCASCLGLQWSSFGGILACYMLPVLCMYDVMSSKWVYVASCVLLSGKRTGGINSQNYCINSIQILLKNKDQVLIRCCAPKIKSAIYLVYLVLAISYINDVIMHTQTSTYHVTIMLFQPVRIFRLQTRAHHLGYLPLHSHQKHTT